MSAAEKYLYRLTLTSRNREKEQNFCNFECDIPSIEELVRRLNERELLIGSWVSSMKGEADDERIITGRRTIAIGRNGIASIELVTTRFREQQ